MIICLLPLFRFVVSLCVFYPFFPVVYAGGGFPNKYLDFIGKNYSFIVSHKLYVHVGLGMVSLVIYEACSFM